MASAAPSICASCSRSRPGARPPSTRLERRLIGVAERDQQRPPRRRVARRRERQGTAERARPATSQQRFRAFDSIALLIGLTPRKCFTPALGNVFRATALVRRNRTVKGVPVTQAASNARALWTRLSPVYRRHPAGHHGLRDHPQLPPRDERREDHRAARDLRWPSRNRSEQWVVNNYKGAAASAASVAGLHLATARSSRARRFSADDRSRHLRQRLGARDRNRPRQQQQPRHRAHDGGQRRRAERMAELTHDPAVPDVSYSRRDCSSPIRPRTFRGRWSSHGGRPRTTTTGALASRCGG